MSDERGPITRDERHLRVVVAAKPREVYTYTTEAAKRLLDREAKHLLVDVEESGEGLALRLFDLKDVMGKAEYEQWKAASPAPSEGSSQ